MFHAEASSLVPSRPSPYLHPLASAMSNSSLRMCVSYPGGWDDYTPQLICTSMATWRCFTLDRDRTWAGAGRLSPFPQGRRGDFSCQHIGSMHFSSSLACLSDIRHLDPSRFSLGIFVIFTPHLAAFGTS